MMLGYWQRPVTIELGNVTHLVTSPMQACRLLLECWPCPDTTLQRAARFACIGAAEGGSPESCRKLFVEASREAGILKE
jgi:hypothetical protein